MKYLSSDASHIEQAKTYVVAMHQPALRHAQCAQHHILSIYKFDLYTSDVHKMLLYTYSYHHGRAGGALILMDLETPVLQQHTHALP